MLLSVSQKRCKGMKKYCTIQTFDILFFNYLFLLMFYWCMWRWHHFLGQLKTASKNLFIFLVKRNKYGLNSFQVFEYYRTGSFFRSAEQSLIECVVSVAVNESFVLPAVNSNHCVDDTSHQWCYHNVIAYRWYYLLSFLILDAIFPFFFNNRKITGRCGLINLVSGSYSFARSEERRVGKECSG